MKIPYDQLINVLDTLGWSIEDIMVEREQRFHDEMNRISRQRSYEPKFIEGPEPDYGQWDEWIEFSKPDVFDSAYENQKLTREESVEEEFLFDDEEHE